MQQLLILSGKGGTGKTTVASALIRLSETRAYADCDVDAPNLHLIMAEPQEAPDVVPYDGLPKAEIDPTLCQNCGRCQALCRFSAITKTDGHYQVDAYACEGCAVCQAFCPAKAVTMVPARIGELRLYQNERRVFSTARLQMGSGASGKLVTEVKRRMREASDPREPMAVIDGSPGIGCPVIASVSGVSLVLIVTEPTLSGLSDLKRLVQTTRRLGVPACVCINRYDVSLTHTEAIEAFCQEEQLPYLGRIPFDPLASQAINQGLSVVELSSPAGDALRQIYQRLMTLLDGIPHEHTNFSKGDD